MVVGSPVQYWKKVVGSPIQYWEKVLGSPVQYCNTEKRFYRFTSPVLEKGSIGSSVQYWVKVVYVLKSNTGKYILGSQSSTGKGSIGSPVEY